MTIDKVPDCIGVMKFERVKEGEEKEAKEVEMDDWYLKKDILMICHIHHIHMIYDINIRI